MPNWPGKNGKMTSHSNFKLRFSKKPLDLVGGFSFEFGVIGEVGLPVVII